MCSPRLRLCCPDRAPGAAGLLLVVACTLTGPALQGARAEAPSAPPATPLIRGTERPDSNLVLLAIELGAEPLGTVIATYPIRDGWLVPLGELARALDLAIEID